MDRLFYVRFCTSLNQEYMEEETPILIRIRGNELEEKIEQYVTAMLVRVTGNDDIRAYLLEKIEIKDLSAFKIGTIFEASQYLLYFNTDNHLWQLRDFGKPNIRVINYVKEGKHVYGMAIPANVDRKFTINSILVKDKNTNTFHSQCNYINLSILEDFYCTSDVDIITKDPLISEVSSIDHNVDITPKFLMDCARTRLLDHWDEDTYVFVIDSACGIDTIYDFCVEAKEIPANIVIYTEQFITDVNESFHPLFTVSACGNSIMMSQVKINEY